MFTGLVEETGRLQDVAAWGQGSRLTIAAVTVLQELHPGDSVAVNGVCLTVVEKRADAFCVEAVAETLQRSTLARLRPGSPVNLERALPANGRFGGHFVQGHVDGVGEVLGLSRRDPGLWLEIRLPEELAPFVVEKGSIAVEGVSLTIARVAAERISIALIPHSAQATTLGEIKSGDHVNIECDIIGKYVARLLGRQRPPGAITDDLLKQWGY